MLDRRMHKFGLRGKAVIPMILGYGCNAPSVYSCRIMETPKQKNTPSLLGHANILHSEDCHYFRIGSDIRKCFVGSGAICI